VHYFRKFIVEENDCKTIREEYVSEIIITITITITIIIIIKL